MSKKIIYIAHSVTNRASKRRIIRALIAHLSEKCRVVRPRRLSSNKMLAATAIRALRQMDLMIADVSTCSHGVGFELGYAYVLKKRIIIICNVGAKQKVSRFILGVFRRILFYEDGEDLIKKVEHRLKLL